MCGICGIIYYGTEITQARATMLRVFARCVLDESQMRGHDATGVCVVHDDRISVLKERIPSIKFTASKAYRTVAMNIGTSKKFQAFIGHTRAQTKGSYFYNVNNHPIIAGSVIGVHNGIITNDDQLFSKFSNDILRAGKVDSEIIFRLIDMYLNRGSSIVEAVQKTTEALIGGYVCAFVTAASIRYVTLFKSSSSSLSLYRIPSLESLVFASTAFILKRAAEGGLPLYTSDLEEVDLGYQGLGMRIDTETGKILKFDLPNNHRYMPRGIYSGGGYNVL